MSAVIKQALFSMLCIVVFGGCATSNSTDDDPCRDVSCSGYGSCYELDGDAVCRCNEGYHASGLQCLPDLCVPEDCVFGHCFDPENSELCECDHGYDGLNCDRCAPGFHMQDLHCVPDGLCDNVECGHGVCVEKDGGAVCECHDGYAGDACDSCAEGFHDEAGSCVADSACNPDPCVHGTCSEIPGGYLCRCETGYAGERCDGCDVGYVADGLICVPDGDPDVCVPNPCQEPNRTRCVEESGEALCLCDEGYILEGDECIPDTENPCASDPCKEPNTVCVAEGEQYRCECEQGYDEIFGVCLASCDVDDQRCAFAHGSFDYLVSANGHGVDVVDLSEKKVANLFVHPYKVWGPTETVDAVTRDVLYDSYFGIMTGNEAVWLNEVAIDYAGYYNQDGIIHWIQHVGEFRIESFAYAPWEIGRPALAMIARVTNLSDEMQSASLYSLHNYHLGNTEGPGDSDPDATDEHIRYDAGSGAYIEQGPGGAMVHMALGEISHFGANDTEVANPWRRLNNRQDLGDESDTGTGSDKVCGFQRDFELEPGERGWLGVLSAFEPNSLLADALLTEVNTTFGEATAKEALAEARAGWDRWRGAEPTGLSDAERWVYRVSEAVLRMGQVHEVNVGGNKPNGQILAALPPGEWAISWVRDMSYAIIGFLKSGHYDEAKAALQFMLDADSNIYRSEVGMDYRISVCRYYGNGTEESDSNFYGPNIEFDGFGLFLWALGEYVRESGDSSFLANNWNTIRDLVADVLVDLIDSNGMIKADSSIWELHWNGQQKQVTYTSLAAAAGLCHASIMADERGEVASAEAWLSATQTIVDGIGNNALDDGFLVQSVEEFVPGGQYVDAAVSEAFNWLLFDPAGDVGDATLNGLDDRLSAAHGYGYFRNDDGGAYDSREWVFIDLRMAHAWRLNGDEAKASGIEDWITAQAFENFGLIAELHDPASGDYLLWSGAAGMGSVPMIGFGAGAYIINMWQRNEPRETEAACGLWTH